MEAQITYPTLILHRESDSTVPAGCGRYLAEHIPGAKYVEIPGTDHMLQAHDPDVLDVILDEVEEFITGVRRRPEPDRVLTTVVFVTSSRPRSVPPSWAIGAGWSYWQSYYSVVRGDLSTFRGREVDTAGDGLLATFDGPARAIRCACSIRDRVRSLGIQVRVGLHIGECELRGERIGGAGLGYRSRTSSLARVFDSPIGERTASRAFPASGGCTPFSEKTKRASRCRRSKASQLDAASRIFGEKKRGRRFPSGPSIGFVARLLSSRLDRSKRLRSPRS
jgi:hypothetical protein